jgi:hypothetical protein
MATRDAWKALELQAKAAIGARVPTPGNVWSAAATAAKDRVARLSEADLHKAFFRIAKTPPVAHDELKNKISKAQMSDLVIADAAPDAPLKGKLQALAAIATAEVDEHPEPADAARQPVPAQAPAVQPAPDAVDQANRLILVRWQRARVCRCVWSRRPTVSG